MNLHIELPIAVETALLARAAAEGKDVSVFVAEVVTERLTESESETKPEYKTGPESETAETTRSVVRSSEGFAHRLQALIDLHPHTGRPVDDSRESIYAGRGE